MMYINGRIMSKKLECKEVVNHLENAKLYNNQKYYPGDDINGMPKDQNENERRIIFGVNHEDVTELRNTVVVSVGTNCCIATEYFVFIGSKGLTSEISLIEAACDEFRTMYNIPTKQPLFYGIVDGDDTQILSLINKPMVEHWWRPDMYKMLLA